MEIEELKKIWDTQNKKPIYIINEEALFRSIRKSKRKASLTSEINEFGLLIIAVACIGFVFYKHGLDAAIYPYLVSIGLFLSGSYVLFGRFRRKKKEKKFGRSVLDDLDHAIANTEFELRRARTFAWWYIAPLIVPVYLNLYMKDASVLTYVLISIGFVFSWFITRLGLVYSQIPKRDRLYRLRAKLLEEPEEDQDRNEN